MDQLLNIIEIIESKYVLNTDLLHSALTLADNCDNIALISIFGPKSHGKTFFINCLINYMNSEHKDEWPYSEDALIKKDYWPQSYDYNITPVIKLTSSPFIITDQIENEEIRTAVFLMDSDFVFDNKMSSQQVQDIIALFLLTSSTVIYDHKRYLPPQEFLRLESVSSRISDIDSSLDSLKNIVFLIRDWSPETRNNEFHYGLYEGSKYIENLIDNMYLDKSYEDLNCFLMSAPELNTQTEVIKLSESNKQFLLDLKNLIDFKLLNIEEMPKKINPKTNEYINATEFFELFQNCVEKLNQNIDNNLFVDSLSVTIDNLTIQDISRDKIDSDLNPSNSLFINRLNPTSESHSNHYSKLYKTQPVLKDKFTKEMKESEKTRPTENQSLRSFDKKLHQDLRKNSYINIENRNRKITKIKHEIRESFVDKNKANETEIENQFRDIIDELLLEYNTSMEIKLKDQILDLNRDLKKTHEIIKQKIFETFEKKYNGINPSSIASYYRDKYYLELNDKINEAIKTYKYKVEMKLNETHDQYQKVLKQLSGLYQTNMKSLIINQMKDDLHTTSLTQIQMICKERAFNTFKEETVKFFKGNIETEFLSKWSEEMNQINYNFQTLWDLYRAHETDRQLIFSELKYYSEEKMKEFRENQKSRIIDSMQKFRDSDLIQFTVSLLETSCDFNKYKSYLAEDCQRSFRFEEEINCEMKSNEYQEKICITEKKLTKARDEAFESYCHSMNAKVSTAQKKSYLKSNEFTELHHRYSKQAIESFNRSADFLNQDYDQEFANKLLIKNESLLRQLITNKKHNFKTLNDNNTPDVHTIAIYLGKQYITAATYPDKKFEIITDKFEQEKIPNSISFGDEILIGTEAKNHYEYLFPYIDSFKNFDIKQLLGRERSDISNEELSEFPFTFLRDKLYVNVNYHGLSAHLSIESLLALMILDIKLCAEKQIGNIMSNIVLTVPTNYTINQKNAVRNAANIAGFTYCDVISEISAAAINYAVEKLNHFTKFYDTLLFIIINDYECDVAICSITNEKIEYKVYFHHTLNSIEEEKSSFFKNILKNNRKYEKNPDSITKHMFKELLDTVLKKANIKSASVQIDECFIAGNSPLIPDIMNWTNKKIHSVICNSSDITKGSAIYGEMMANKINFIEISEVTTHNIYLNFDIKSSKGKLLEVMPKNTSLPIDRIISFPLPQFSDLPLIITVSQDNQIVKTHRINVLPNDYKNHNYIKHLINVEFDCFGQISPIMSFLSNNDNTPATKLESIEINPGLNDEDLIKEKQKLYSLRNKIHEEIKLNEEKLCLEQAINELRSYCLSVKNEVENNVDLRPLIKKQIVSELDKTLSFLCREHSNLNEITKQKQMLDKTFEGYNYAVKNS